VSKLNFLTAGRPNISQTVLSGLEDIKKLGLDGMELEYVHGLRKNLEAAKEIKKVKEKNNLVLTAHGPFFINLNSFKQDKIDASIRRIIDSAEQAYTSGAYSLTFHAGFYQGISKEQTYKTIRKNMKNIVAEVKDKGYKIWIRPETTGKETQFGSLDEIISLSQEMDGVLPCVDFSHIHARSEGKFNTKQEFNSLLEKIEKGLGKMALENVHIHLSGINYTTKGERNHMNLKDSDMQYKDLLQTLKDYKVKGALVCESPNIEVDTSMLKKYYLS
jgi:deoxyribonuclease-4